MRKRTSEFEDLKKMYQHLTLRCPNPRCHCRLWLDQVNDVRFCMNCDWQEEDEICEWRHRRRNPHLTGDE